MEQLAQKVMEGLAEDLESNRLILPALPEVARKVQQMVEDPETSVAQVAAVIKTDTALSARLLQIANSALYRPTHPATSVQVAVTRLGTHQVRAIVTSLVMEQLYKTKTSEPIRQRLKALWQHSVKVAALAHVFARHARRPTEEALLAGIVHDIGTLPVLVRADAHPELCRVPAVLDWIIEEMHPQIGAIVLRSWNFAEELISVAGEHENLMREHESEPDLVDLIIVANLHCGMGTPNSKIKMPWDRVPAFAKLGLDPESSLEAIRRAQQEVEQIRQLLANG